MALRFIRFNIVSLLGVGVRLLVAALLVNGAGLHYLVATAIAIEASIVHNFFWHRHWTWENRATRGPGRPAVNHGHVFFTCVAFHASNGLVSMLGSLVLMPMFVGGLHAHYLLANLAAVGCTGLLNFVLGDRLVFRNE
jgi:putative flippase GtrA